MHITVDYAKTILTNILNDLPEEKEELLEEESQLTENKPLPDSSQPIVELANETEITLNFEWMFEIEDDFFDDFGNTTLYHKIIQPQQSRDSHILMI